MKYIQSKRIYAMSDNDMWWIIRRIINYLRDDIPSLSKYGINEAKVDSLDSLCRSVEYARDDEHYQININEATREVKAAISKLKDSIRMSVCLPRACFGDKSAFVKNLELSNYSRFSFEKLISASKSIIPLLESNLESLKEVGLTAERIQDLSDKIKSAEDAKLAQKKDKEDRINATKNRIKTFNETYEQVMIYANIANAVLAKTNPRRAKYYTLSHHRKMKRENEAELRENAKTAEESV